jgi:transposase
VIPTAFGYFETQRLQTKLSVFLGCGAHVTCTDCQAHARPHLPQIDQRRLVLIATTYVLTVEDPYRFRKSRDAGSFVGLQPGRRNSGESEPQMHITKEGDEYVRTLLVQGVHDILGPFGEDRDLRRWGQKLAARGGKNGKKRAVVAVARKLAVLLHRLWVSREVYEPLRNSQKVMSAAA